jgi:hypothetical protein
MKRQILNLVVFLGLYAASCAPKTDEKDNQTREAHKTETAVSTQNQLSEAEEKEGWILLFDGKTTNGWHLYNKGKVTSAWEVQNEELYCNRETRQVEHGDLVTDKEFEDFDLKFEWKITKEGNSGIFINVVEKKEIPTTWASGPEYQLLEKTHPDYEVNPSKRPGCLYNFAPQKNTVEPKPTGEWNEGRIKQVKGKVAFYLNGVLTAEQDFTTQEWKDKISQTNFKAFPQFGKSTKGRIALQDWAKAVSFRNLKIKEL